METIPYDNVLIYEMGNGSTPFTDLDGLALLLENQNSIKRFYIGLENNCHVHFTVDFKFKIHDKLIKDLRDKLYQTSKLPKKGKGGANAIVIKPSLFDLEKYKELNQQEQKYKQYIYTFKEYDSSRNTSRIFNILPETCQKYKNDHWDMYRKIIKLQALKKKTNSQKQKSLRDNLKDYFQKNRKQKISAEGKTKYLRMDASEYVKIVASWYQMMEIEHSVTDCERRTLMLIAMSNQELHQHILVQNLGNKLLY